MPVRRYRDVSEVPPPAPAGSPEEGLAAACALSELCGGLGPSPRGPRGVVRFRSVEEADDHRRGWRRDLRQGGTSRAAAGD